MGDLKARQQKVAILYQAGPTPSQGGIRKPPKPGGYRDSGADIAYALKIRGVVVLTPHPDPDPATDQDWVFGDDAPGIRAALDAGATMLWANTTLYQGHPLALYRGVVGVVGPNIAMVDQFEDKWVMNQWLHSHQFPVPEMWKGSEIGSRLFDKPLVLKPRRGRGSQGVRRLEHRRDLQDGTATDEDTTFRSETFVVEEFLPGEEVTVTTMPPGYYVLDGMGTSVQHSWALPPIMRRDHQNGIMPYSGEVPVIDNSLVAHSSSPELEMFVNVCQGLARQLLSRAWLRIDGRQDEQGTYRIIDVNFKPNLTGPGRPGRDHAVSLVAMAAAACGWQYGDLVANLLQSQDWMSPF